MVSHTSMPDLGRGIWTGANQGDLNLGNKAYDLGSRKEATELLYKMGDLIEDEFCID